MRIKLSPDGNIPLDMLVTKQDDTVTINGEVFDFSPMRNGDTLPQSAISGTWFRADVERLETGELVVTLALPNGPNASHEQRFPEDLTNVQNGNVALPQPLASQPPEEEQDYEQH